MTDPPLTHPLLVVLGVEHGFGVRGSAGPSDLRRPTQVHGRVVVDARELTTHLSLFPQLAHAPQLAHSIGPPDVIEADAVVSDEAGLCVGVVTADCVPILIAEPNRGAVAVVHAGWKGLASGVIASSLSALAERGADPARMKAVVGPYIGQCCYEIDEPVLSALCERFGSLSESTARPTRTRHAMLDLGALAIDELNSAGLAARNIGKFDSACTMCDPQRFHSYRRDGSKAGRLLHFIRTPPRGGSTAELA